MRCCAGVRQLLIHGRSSGSSLCILACLLIRMRVAHSCFPCVFARRPEHADHPHPRRGRRFHQQRRCAPLVVMGAKGPSGAGLPLADLDVRKPRRKLGSQVSHYARRAPGGPER
eukprot:2934376-Alexandrium_andersonii.AAC.1